MLVFKCKMCGGNLEVTEDQVLATCEYCGTQQTLPKIDDEKKLALFNRANNLRLKCEFDKAIGVYETIVAEFPEEAEAYWGLVLCKYGIEYVDDSNGKKVPTCHRTLPTSIMEDTDFEQACENADITAKTVYREEAKAIDKIQQKILDIALNEEPYDIFICYKETDDITGARTDDSAIAQDIYTQLIKAGFKVFFARDSLRDVAGTEYEPYIYAALSSAKIMLAIGTKFEYYDAVWVKNEWSRFISMMAEDSSKTLIPCYKDMDAYDMPKEFKNMQGLNMSEVTFFGSLMANIERVATKKKEVKVIKDSADKKTVMDMFKLNEEKEKLMSQANAIDFNRKRSVLMILSGIFCILTGIFTVPSLFNVNVFYAIFMAVVIIAVAIVCFNYKLPTKKVIDERTKQKEELLKQCEELQNKIDSIMK